MSDGSAGQPAGWYPEPGTGRSRWWDGTAWGQYADEGAGVPGGGMPGVKPSKDKAVAGILGILLGAFGAHKFYLGYSTPAIIMLVGSLIGICGSILILPILITTVFGVIGLVEGIIYLTKSDEEFQATYVDGTKEWF